VGGAEEPAAVAPGLCDLGLCDLGLAPDLIAAAAGAGWATATAIQAQAIPAVLQGRDVLGLAPTGSGKTAAFLLPLLHQLLAVPGVLDERPRRLRALVLAPTREIAAQIEAAASALAPALKTVLAVGGVSINPQMMALRGGAHLVVATPGRLLDLLGQRALLLGGVQTLVLDEADRLLDLGFADEIQRVLAWLPAKRQNLLFTATLPSAVAALADAVLRDAVHIDVRPSGDAPAGAVTQRAIEVDTAQRTPLLRQLISQEGWTRVLVFVATQYASEHVADKLRQAGLPAAALHGQLSAGRRRQALLDLADGRLAVLVATDLAARGIDVDGLAVVVNHDLPRSAVDYTHRLGRTGRAGATGLAVSFICADAPGSEAHFRLIEKRQAQRVARERVPGFEPGPAAAPALAPDPQGGIKGRRKSKKDKLREAAAKG
jgi:ATP-dependent RNA helicase RhlE